MGTIYYSEEMNRAHSPLGLIQRLRTNEIGTWQKRLWKGGPERASQQTLCIEPTSDALKRIFSYTFQCGAAAEWIWWWKSLHRVVVGGRFKDQMLLTCRKCPLGS